MRKNFKLLFAIIVMALATMINPLQLTNSYNDSVAQAATIKLNKTSVTLIKGQSYQLKIIGTKRKVTWNSSNKSICTVNSKGKVTSRAKGTTYIYAKVSSKKYKCKVVVVTPSISKKTLTLQSGSTYQLKILGTTAKVKWESNNVAICSVSSTGKLSPDYSGTTTITATVLGKKYYCKVTVPRYYKPSKSSITLQKGASFNLNIYNNYYETNTIMHYETEDSTIVSCKWRDLNFSTIPCSCPITIKGLKLGKTKITFTNNINSTKFVVTVTVRDNSVKSNLLKLKNYIRLYGDTNSSNNKFISKINYVSYDNKEASTIVYDSITDKLQFIKTTTFGTLKTAVEMDMNCSDLQIINPKITILFTDDETFISASCKLYPYEYYSDFDAYSALKFNVSTTTEIDDEGCRNIAGGEYLRALKDWNYLLISNLNMTLEDIGFVNCTGFSQ